MDAGRVRADRQAALRLLSHYGIDHEIAEIGLELGSAEFEFAFKAPPQRRVRYVLARPTRRHGVGRDGSAVAGHEGIRLLRGRAPTRSRRDTRADRRHRPEHSREGEETEP